MAVVLALELELELDELLGAEDAPLAPEEAAAVLEPPPRSPPLFAVSDALGLAGDDELLAELELLELLELDVPPELDDEQPTAASAAMLTIANSWVFLRLCQRDIGVSIWCGGY